MIHQGKDYEDLVVKKYCEMKEKGITEDFLDQARLGGIKLFINTKPYFTLSSFRVEESDTIYIGANEL